MQDNFENPMKEEGIFKNTSQKQIFEKYPKNYQENKHYRSVKEKMLTAEDEQEIIKFPFTQRTSHTQRDFLQNCPISNSRNIQKHKGKKYETIPLRTISYTTPVPFSKAEQLSNTLKITLKKQAENKFNSKFLFTNMKKLKDMRKSNYKTSKNSSGQKIEQSPKQKQIEQQVKLDLFKITSTNFKYQKEKTTGSSQCPEDDESARKLALTQGGKRNVIRFKGESSPKKRYVLNNGNNQPQQNMVESQIVLYPAKTEQNIVLKSIQDEKFTAYRQELRTREKSTKERGKYASVKILNQPRRSENVTSPTRPQFDDQSEEKTFMRYSQTQVALESSFLTREGKKPQDQSPKKPSPYSQLQHMTSPFKGSFRIKHIEDNKNVLMTTIRKKAHSLTRDQLMVFIKKVVK